MEVSHQGVVERVKADGIEGDAGAREQFLDLLASSMRWLFVPLPEAPLGQFATWLSPTDPESGKVFELLEPTDAGARVVTEIPVRRWVPDAAPDQTAELSWKPSTLDVAFDRPIEKLESHGVSWIVTERRDAGRTPRKTVRTTFDVRVSTW